MPKLRRPMSYHPFKNMRRRNFHGKGRHQPSSQGIIVLGCHVMHPSYPYPPPLQEALLFEQAEADSLNYLERQVFFNSRILHYGEEDSLSGVPLCIKCLAWLFIVVYAVGLSFYVCLFAVKAGRATSVQWMISFWVAFFEVSHALAPLPPLPAKAACISTGVRVLFGRAFRPGHGSVAPPQLQAKRATWFRI